MSTRMDSIVSRARAAARGVEARLHGLVGAFATLSEQHAAVLELLRRVKRDPSKRSALWPEIRAELLSHEKAELREIYPVINRHAELRALVLQHDVEASDLGLLVDRLHATEISSEQWGALFDRLTVLVEQHVRLEEHEIFPRAQEAIGAARARDIEPRLLAAKKQALAAL